MTSEQAAARRDLGAATGAVVTMLVALASSACGRSAPPPADVPPVPTIRRAPVDAAPGDGAGGVAVVAGVAESSAEPPAPRIATWSSKPAGSERPRSPACIARGDRFIQYADLDAGGALRFCLWWNLGRPEQPDVGCWRVDLATGSYAGEVGVWFSAAQPLRVGAGGPSLGTGAVTARWRDGSLEICRGVACRRLPFQQSPGTYDEDIAVDRGGQLAVVPLGGAPGGKAREFATVDLTTDTQLATWRVSARHDVALAGFVGPSVMVTDCDPHAGGACTWDLYNPRSGARLGAVGGSHPLGTGGTAALIDDARFAAVAGAHLVVQDASTAKVTASIELPRAAKLRADYVVFQGAGGLVLPGPDGRVVLVDPVAGKITRTLVPPPCPPGHG